MLRNTGAFYGLLRSAPINNNAKARWLALVLIAAIGVVHAWIISAGRFTHWPTRTAYYSLLADGFLKGQVSLPIKPDPRLLETPDPYDPRFNSRLRLQDAVLYDGKYYIYWGPLPALLLVPVRLVTGGAGEPIGDQYVFFAFALALAAISAKLILRARWRFFPEAPWWTIGFGIVIAGLVNPIPFLLANASIYQTAIVGGQVFLLSGTYAAWLAWDPDAVPAGSAVRTDSPAIEGQKRRGRFSPAPGTPGESKGGDLGDEGEFGKAPSLTLPRSTGGGNKAADVFLTPGTQAVATARPWLFVAGACWAMAVGCRISLAPAVGALSCLVAWRLWSDAPRLRDAGRSLVCLAVPLLAGAGLFAAYNQVRFGSPVEFGARYILAGQNMHAMVATGTFVSARYVPVNLVRYLLESPVLQGRFPFICPIGTAAWGWFGIRVSKDFIMDSVAGMVWAAPVFGLAAVPVWAGLRRLRLGLARRDGGSREATTPLSRPTAPPPDYPTTSLPNHAATQPPDGPTTPPPNHPTTPLPAPFWWLVTALLIASVVGFLPSLMVAASTMRYLADATPSLAILASVGMWMHGRPATTQQGARRMSALVILTAYSALMGVLLGVAGHYGRFVIDGCMAP